MIPTETERREVGYAREAVEHELERIGATTWRLILDRSWFKGRDFGPGEVEFSSDEWGATCATPAKILADLRMVPDGAGDEGIAMAWFAE